MNKHFYRQGQRGVSIPMVLSLIAVMMILALTFMGVTRFQTQRTGFEQATITSAYVAEIGFQQVRAKLSAVGGDWTQLPATEIEQDCTLGNANRLRCQKSPVDDDFEDLHAVYENPLDTSSRIIGRYEYTIETGQKRDIFGNKTVLGSDVGFIPGDLVEQVGYDVYGNKLCDASVPGGSCPGNFVGVKVKAWLTDAQGNEIPNARPQTVYGVLSMDSRDPDDQGPSGYMLESDETMQISANTAYEPDSPQGMLGQMTSYGFYGPVHTNQSFRFVWESMDDTYSGAYKVTKSGSNMMDELYADPGNAKEIALWRRPFWGILMADLGAQWATAPRVRPEVEPPPSNAGNYAFIPYGRYYRIEWLGARPADGATYSVHFMSPEGEKIVNVTKPSGAVDKGIPSPLVLDTAYQGMRYRGQAWPITKITVGATTYSVDTHFKFSSPNILAWNAYPDTSREFGAGEVYRARLISHSPISIQEKMTYSGGTPQYVYQHTHPSTTNYPFYQTSHGHTNVAGADLGANSVSDYDADTWTHTHPITNNVSEDPVISVQPATVDNTFLKFASNAYKPTSAASHVVPLLKATSDIGNYKNQLEQLNKYLELTLGVTLPRNGDGSINASGLGSAPFNTSDYSKGYIVGKFPSTHPNTSPPQVDFRAVYFGKREQTYNAGSAAGQRIIATTDDYNKTEPIWVNDKATSIDYMKVANTQLNSDYHRYLFRQIPPEKVILVRDATVLIGNMKPQGNTCVGYQAHCLDFLPGYASDAVGEATIVNGQLSILSFTTTPTPDTPENEAQYNYGDIVIVGNVLYHNDFYATPSQKSEMRQLSAQPTTPYTRSNTRGGGISTITDSGVEWVTNTDGTRYRNTSGQLVGSLDGLGLFATQDVKISVTPMGNGYTKQSFLGCSSGGTADTYEDNLTIHGQLVAGNRVRVQAHLYSTPIPNLQRINLVTNACSIEPPYESYKDKLTFYGTIYSRESVNFSEYFKIKREYYFDRSLQKNPLVGAPYYPKTPGDYKNQTVFNNFPSLVPGTWVQGAQ